ncbi:MAG: von Willebrand factor type A domain-containing protein [Bacteroidota bacterium]
MKRIFLLAGLATLLFACTPTERGTVKGIVTETGLEDPIKGVTVVVKGSSTIITTNHLGAYSLKLRPGKHLLEFSAYGMETYEEEVQIVKGETLSLDVVLGSEPLVLARGSLDNNSYMLSENMGFAKAPKSYYKAPSLPTKSRMIATQPGQKQQGAGTIPDSISAAGSTDPWSTEEYPTLIENEYLEVTNEPLSTFSIDVDNASYTNVRRMIENGQRVSEGAVRIEEMVNFFDYDYPNPEGRHPFSVTTEVADCPWADDRQLLHIGLQGKKMNYEEAVQSNLVFLIDVSGSMSAENKLPLVKKSLEKLVHNLKDDDRVAIVVYAGAAGEVLPSTEVSKKGRILGALRKLESGGSTAGGEGIVRAYKIAKKNLLPDGNNRVVLCTDGDFNVGVSSTDQLVKLIEEKRKDDIYLTICGYGMGNYKDGRMEDISNAGNGNYFYIDGMREVEKVFERELLANFFTIAKDVKMQLEFNPNTVHAYRLVGYENRLLQNEDFNDDTKDAGELGAGHTVTALYEVVLKEDAATLVNGGRSVDALKYQNHNQTAAASSEDLVTLKLRYKPIKSRSSILMETIVSNKRTSFEEASESFRFAAAVAHFGMILRHSKFLEKGDYNFVFNYAKLALGDDPNSDRAEFLQLLTSSQEQLSAEY